MLRQMTNVKQEPSFDIIMSAIKAMGKNVCDKIG